MVPKVKRIGRLFSCRDEPLISVCGIVLYIILYFLFFHPGTRATKGRLWRKDCINENGSFKAAAYGICQTMPTMMNDVQEVAKRFMGLPHDFK